MSVKETRVCLVCLQHYETGAIILHPERTKALGPESTDGYGLCPPHRQPVEQDYVHLIEMDSGPRHGKGLEAEEILTMRRTGLMLTVKREALEQMMRIPLSPQPVAACQRGFIPMVAGYLGIQLPTIH